MVGVPGKYKGCNTCRKRRVKCDMARPACEKCIHSNRSCGGYEREITFIVGTINEKGRCASHPHRSTLKPRANNETKKSSSRKMSPAESSETSPYSNSPPAPPPTSGTRSQTPFLHTPSQCLDPHYGNDSDEAFSLPSLDVSLPYLHPPQPGHEFFPLVLASVEDKPKQKLQYDPHPRARKRTHADALLANSQDEEEQYKKQHPTQLFICSTAPEKDKEGMFKHLLGGSSESVKARGPEAYQESPAHEFFTRVWRPLATTYALSNHQRTFLGRDEWISGPFEKSGKTLHDQLWDIVARLPEICARARRSIKPSRARGVDAQHGWPKALDLLVNCSVIHKKFEQWFTGLQGADEETETNGFMQPLYWTVQQLPRSSQGLNTVGISPFHGLQFRDMETAQLLTTYWTSRIVFYRMVAEVLAAAERSQNVNSSYQLPHRLSTSPPPTLYSTHPAPICNDSASPTTSVPSSDFSNYSLPTSQPYMSNDTSNFEAMQASMTPRLFGFNAKMFEGQSTSAFSPFITDTYAISTSYAPATMTYISNLATPTYESNPEYTDMSYQPLLIDEPTQFYSDPSSFNDLSDPAFLLGINSDSYNGSNFQPPPQCNPTPPSFMSQISQPASHPSPGSYISSSSHAPTPPDVVQQTSTGGSNFNTPDHQHSALYYNSRPDNLKALTLLVGSGVDYIVGSDDGDVTLLHWSLSVMRDVLEGQFEEETVGEQWCGVVKEGMRARMEEVGRGVRAERWDAGGGEWVM